MKHRGRRVYVSSFLGEQPYFLSSIESLLHFIEMTNVSFCSMPLIYFSGMYKRLSFVVCVFVFPCVYACGSAYSNDTMCPTCFRSM